MRRKRYLAPWERQEAAEPLRALDGKPAIYHFISRIIERKFLLGDAEREQFVAW